MDLFVENIYATFKCQYFISIQITVPFRPMILKYTINKKILIDRLITRSFCVGIFLCKKFSTQGFACLINQYFKRYIYLILILMSAFNKFKITVQVV